MDDALKDEKGGASEWRGGEPAGTVRPDARYGEESGAQRGRREQARETDAGIGHDMYAKIVEGVRDHAIFALDTQGHVQMWNHGAELLTGYESNEVIGQPYTLFGARDGEADVARVLQSAHDTGSFRQERWWRRRDGTLVWVEELISPLNGSGYMVITHDLTERVELDERRHSINKDDEGDRERALRRELQAAERRASFLAEASSILVATSLDFDSTVKALARLAVSRLADWCVIHAMGDKGDLRRAEVAHRNPELEPALEKAVDISLGAVWRKTVRSVMQTGQAQILDGIELRSWFDRSEDELLAQVGRASAIVTPLLGRGVVLGTVTFVTTDSERGYEEDDLALAEELGRRAAIALDNARLYREAQEANRAKADFLAVISHELRTPLNAIMGYSDLLDAGINGGLSDRQHRHLDRIRASARHLLQLIEEILSYARMEAGGEEVHLDDADAREIAREAAAVIEPMAQEKNLELVVSADGPPLMLQTDAGKVRQVLVNLLSNAVKFTESGRVEMRVSLQEDQVVFDVVDTGVGIPKRDLGRIFDPFWQAERPNTRRVGGTGLGLSVSRRYVRLLGGTLQLSSEVGRGTQARVTLPPRGSRKA